VKRLFAWVAGAAGGLAAYRALKGKHAEPEPQSQQGADARAAELKAKLEEARVVADDRDAFESGEVAVDEADLVDPQARRAQVHEQGRAALDEMRGDQTP
jgi:hypothetical protein